jgi:hypothetical protein
MAKRTIEHVTFEVWERGQLIDTFDSRNRAVYSAAQYGCSDTTVVRVTKTGRKIDRETVWQLCEGCYSEPCTCKPSDCNCDPQ